MLQILLVLLYIQALISGFVFGLWIAREKKERTQSVATDFFPKKHVDNLGKSPGVPYSGTPQPKTQPKSMVRKFPDPEKVRQQKDRDQLDAYLADMRQNKRPSGSFVL